MVERCHPRSGSKFYCPDCAKNILPNDIDIILADITVDETKKVIINKIYTVIEKVD